MNTLTLWKSLIAIALGAILGALLRWLLGVRFNQHFPAIPPGTLIANLIGAYVIGVGIAYFALVPTLSPAWRLFIITGFCGSLTTFSSFSAEIVSLLQQGRMALAFGAIAAHVAGSLLMTFAGIGSVYFFKGSA